MIDALLLIAPFFAVVLVGYAAGKLGVFDNAGLGGLNAFIFKIALPPLLFRVMMQAPATTDAAWPYLAAWGAATLALYGLARLAGRLVFGLRGGFAAVHGHLAVNGNVGFLGLPLVAAALGPEAALPTALALTFDILVVMSLTTLSLEAATGAGGFFRALFRTLINPIALAVLGGVAWRYYADLELGLAMPSVVIRFMDLLGQAAAPAALFATGATLAHRALDRRVGELAAMSLWKLVAHPLAVILAFALIAPDMPAVWIAAAVLSAAIPSSNNAVVFANAYGVYEARASATVLLTTALSLGSFAVVLAWIEAGGLEAALTMLRGGF